MTLGAFSGGVFFVFSKFSNLAFLWPYLALVLKSGAVFVWSVQILSFFAWASSWAASFFKKMRFCARDGRPALLFFSKSPDFALFLQKSAQSAVPFFFGWPWLLDIAHGHVPRCLKGVCFGIFWKSWLAKKWHGVYARGGSPDFWLLQYPYHCCQPVLVVHCCQHNM